MNDFNINNKIRHLLDLAIINLNRYDLGGNDKSLVLWRAYVNIEYAILILKLSYNNNKIQPLTKPKKSNIKDAIVTETKMKTQDNIHAIRRLKFILQHLDFQDKKVLLKELRLNRDVLKKMLQKDNIDSIRF